MTYNIYNNQELFNGYGQLLRSQFGLEAALEWLAIQMLLPESVRQAGYRSRVWIWLVCGRAREAGVVNINLSEKC